MYKKLTDLNAEMFAVRQQVDVRGKSVGWDWDMLPYTIKEGTTTYIGAAPASGKTELWFEFLINLSCLHGWNHVVFSPETGSSAEIFAELCYKYIGKPYVQGQNSMTHGEQARAEMFIDKHFIVIDPIDEPSVNVPTHRASNDASLVSSLSGYGFEIKESKPIGQTRFFAASEFTSFDGTSYDSVISFWRDASFERNNPQHPFAYAKSASITYSAAVEAIRAERPLIRWKPSGSVGFAYIHPDCSSKTEQKVGNWLNNK